VAAWRGLASGVLWDRRPGPVASGDLSNAERTDSAAKAIIRHYRDSLAALPGGGRMVLPSWTATIGGKEYGIDAQWITVAGVKVPSFLLALIPLPNAGNESEALNPVGTMRAEDYWMAMPRQAAAADREEEIKAIRKRNAAEQKLKAQQRDTNVRQP
jgi:hypothetical protein